jgi:hypothetical protein
MDPVRKGDAAPIIWFLKTTYPVGVEIFFKKRQWGMPLMLLAEARPATTTVVYCIVDIMDFYLICSGRVAT